MKIFFKKVSSPRCHFCLNCDETVENFFIFLIITEPSSNCVKMAKTWPPSLVPKSGLLWKTFVHFVLSSKRLSFSCVSQKKIKLKN